MSPSKVATSMPSVWVTLDKRGAAPSPSPALPALHVDAKHQLGGLVDDDVEL